MARRWVVRAAAIGERGLRVANRLLRVFGLVLRSRAAAIEAEGILAEIMGRQMRATQEARAEVWRMRRQLVVLDELLIGAGQSALSATAKRLVRVALGREEERAA